MTLVRRVVTFTVACGLGFVPGCTPGRTEEEREAPVEIARPRAPMAHGDHLPRYGGTVWMDGDLHFEVVLDPEGKHRVYFSDAFRTELPAATVSDVRVTIVPKTGESEPLALEIDEFGESWVASGRPVDDPEARALVAFTYEGEPYQIDIPFVAAPPDPNAPDPHAIP